MTDAVMAVAFQAAGNSGTHAARRVLWSVTEPNVVGAMIMGSGVAKRHHSPMNASAGLPPKVPGCEQEAHRVDHEADLEIQAG